ncbi:MAG: hypothetical protein RJA22_2109 [Verrucomicrobiota bacterium]|jgi:uncharacterized membrane protein (UPF0136 family)
MNSPSPLHTSTARWMIGYGVFLALMGLAGFLTNPEKAKTALLSGGTFGALSVLWGWLMQRGLGFSRWAAFATTVLLLGVFSWRAAVSWEAFAIGNSAKLIPAILISTMAIASLVMALLLARLPRSGLPVATQ